MRGSSMYVESDKMFFLNVQLNMKLSSHILINFVYFFGSIYERSFIVYIF